jgi:hypothetical protein
MSTSAEAIEDHVFQQSDCFEHKLLTTIVEEIFNASIDFRNQALTVIFYDTEFGNTKRKEKG